MSTKEAYAKGIEAAWHGLHSAATDMLKTDADAVDAARMEAYLDVVMAATGRSRESVMRRVAERMSERALGRLK